jgi:hypothetical protein
MDISLVPDTVTYLGVFDFDFDQNPVRKYRVIVPLLARAVHSVFGGVFERLAPETFPGNFSVGMSFLVVNNLIMSLFAVFVYRFIAAYSSWILASIVGLLSVLTCRWTGGFAGLPLVDSLYLLVLAMTLLGLKTQNKTLIIVSIFLGPWAKESFIFIAPIIFFYAPVSKKKQILLFALSGILVFSFRYFIDTISGSSASGALQRMVSHFGDIPISLKRLLSFHGIYEIFSVTGFWFLLIIPAIVKKVFWSSVKRFEPFVFWFIVSVFFQTILSTDVARMLYLLTPVLAVLWSILLERVIPDSLKVLLGMNQVKEASPQ